VTALSSNRKTVQAPRKLNRYPFWAPRFWHGMVLGDWLRLVARHRGRIHLLRLGLAATVTAMAVVNSGLAWLQRLCYGRRLEQVVIDQPPLFIIGHWRSGTTMLHEMLVRDTKYAYPTTYECFAARHYLVTGTTFPKLFWRLLPAKRPMDDMATSFNHPQEDEFAMLSMGAPSPLLRIAFPNDPPPYLDFLDMEGNSDQELAAWKRCLLEFVRGQTLLKGKRLVLKSPTHTGRIEVLSKLFPGAQFIHIVRDPQTLFPSNRRLWRSLDEVQGFQVPHHRDVDQFVFTAFERMYRGFEQQRDKVPAGCLVETRYEDLVANPIGEVERLYTELSLGDFESVRERIEEYVAIKKDYKVNRHQLDPETRSKVNDRWGDYQRRYGYDDEA
jgi:hypothetical protein